MNVDEILEKYRIGIVNYRIKALRFSALQAKAELRKLVESKKRNNSTTEFSSGYNQALDAVVKLFE